MATLLSDGRILFLLVAIVFAIIFACVLIFIEFRIKRKDIGLIERMAIETPIYRMENFLMGDNSPKEKLSVVDKTAKAYFNRVYGTELNEDYSNLISKFNGMGLKLEAIFCKVMFEGYYLDDRLTDERVRKLGNMLVDVENKRMVDGEINRRATFMNFIDKVRDNIIFVLTKRRRLAEEKKVAREVDKKVSEKVADKNKKDSLDIKKANLEIDRIEREYIKEKTLRKKMLQMEAKRIEREKINGVKNLISSKTAEETSEELSFDEDFAKFQNINNGGVAERIVRTERANLGEGGYVL